MAKETHKREKVNDVLEAVEDWVNAYELESSTEDEFDECCKNLAKAFHILETHKSTARPPMKDHPDGDYYTIEVGGQEIRRVRCKKCAAELDPRGFSRHINGPVCKKNRERLVEKNKKKNNKNKK